VTRTEFIQQAIIASFSDPDKTLDWDQNDRKILIERAQRCADELGLKDPPTVEANYAPSVDWKSLAIELAASLRSKQPQYRTSRDDETLRLFDEAMARAEQGVSR
jgi:hypothetical protein